MLRIKRLNRLSGVLCLLLLSLNLQARCLNDSKDKIASLPGLGKIRDCEFAGMLPVQKQNDKHAPQLFYWLVEKTKQTNDTPLILWLNGGPGAASLYGFFLENGPYSVTQTGLLVKRSKRWSTVSDYVVIDQPVGVGLSYGSKESFKNEAQTTAQLAFAVNAFFKRYPALKTHPFYLAGESHAGKTIPPLALKLLTQETPLNLKGILIGDGWVNPTVQLGSDAEYAYTHGLIDFKDVKRINSLYQHCRAAIKAAHPSTRSANRQCNAIQDYILERSGAETLANIETFSEPDDKSMTAYLNRKDVRQALHVPSYVGRFRTFNETVSNKLEVGLQDEMAHVYPQLLAKGLRILIYNGLEDAKDANFIGTDRWLRLLSWPGQKEFNAQASRPLYNKHHLVAYIKSFKGLTQVKILHAGHMVAADQPDVMLNILSDFIQDKKDAWRKRDLPTKA